MENALPLDKMTIEDKLAAMEQLWDDLCRNPESVPPVLARRENPLGEREAGSGGKSQIF